MAKEGSTVSGLMDTIATMTSIALQYGVPLKALVDKFSHTRFEPAGFTNNREIPIAKSVMDYVFRYLGNRYLAERKSRSRRTSRRPRPEEVGARQHGFARGEGRGRRGGASAPRSLRCSKSHVSAFVNQADAPSCMDCGDIMVRNGACYKCLTCGTTSGCS